MSHAVVPSTSSRPIRRLRRAGIVLGLSACASLVAGGAVVGVVLPSSADAQGVVGLERGSSGPAVREVQVALMNQGISIHGGADGVYGQVTEDAIKAFQKRNKLSQSGVVDDATASALGLSTQSASSPSGFVGLSRGMKGADVRLLQHTLIRSGWSLTVGPDGTPDGVFGAETEAAVRDVQRVNGLEATGVVNEATASVLGVSESWGGDGELAQGASGDKVRQVQEAIVRDGGYLFGGADGHFGPGTTSAVKKYQLVNDLSVTGVVDQATADVMGISLSGSSSGSSESSASSNDASSNDTGSSSEGSSDGGSSSRGDGGSSSGGSSSDGTSSGGSAEQQEAAIQYSQASSIVGLEVGHKGKPVRRVQEALTSFGYVLRGGIDGLYGPETEGAIEHFQSSNGIDASGAINRATAKALGLTGNSGNNSSNGSSSNSPDDTSSSGGSDAPPSYSHPYGGLQVGSTGDKVSHVQEALLDTGLVLLGGADGQFGPATESAVKSFQQVNGLDITGIVDDATAKILDPQPSSSSGSGDSNGAGDPGRSDGAGIGNAPSVSIDAFPVGGSCWFGNSWHAPRGGGRVHLGVDIIADTGQPVYAATSGEITRRYIDKPGSLAGNGLRLTRDDGTYFFYAHLDSFAPGIKAGTRVQAGDVIGTVGNTGNSAMPHLHFEVHPKGGNAVDPTSIVRNARSGGC